MAKALKVSQWPKRYVKSLIGVTMACQNRIQLRLCFGNLRTSQRVQSFVRQTPNISKKQTTPTNTKSPNTQSKQIEHSTNPTIQTYTKPNFRQSNNDSKQSTNPYKRFCKNQKTNDPTIRPLENPLIATLRLTCG